MIDVNKQSPKKSERRAATKKLFEAVRSDCPLDVMRALNDGADPQAVSRGMTPLQRALKYFPWEWHAHVVGSLMPVSQTMPELAPEELMKLANGLAIWGQAEALIQLLHACDERFRQKVLYMTRVSFCRTRHLSNEDFQKMVSYVFTDPSEAEQREASNKVSWLHHAVVGVDVEGVGIQLATGGRPQLHRLDPDPRLLKHLLSLGPDVDVRWLGMTPLHLAAFIGNEIATEALLAADADPDLPDGNNAFIGRGYGDITDAQLALIESYRLRKALLRAAPAVRARL